MAKNEAQIDLTASDAKLINVLSRSETRIKNYGREAIHVFKRVNASLISGFNNLGALGPLGASFGVFAMVKDMIEFDNVLRKIGRTSGASAGDMAALRKEIIDLISPGSGIPLTKGEFTDMAEALNATGISMNVIRGILPQVGKGAVASQTDVKIYAETIGELMDKYKVAATDLPALQDQLNAAMKMDDVRKSPEAFLQSISSMSKTMQLIKAQGMGNVTPLIALLTQLTKFGGGSSTEAASSLDAIFTGLRRNQKMLMGLKAYGIEFYDQKKSIKNIKELIPEFKKLGALLEKKGLGEQATQLLFGGRGTEAAKALQIILMHYDEVIKSQEDITKSTDNMSKDFQSESVSMASKLKLFQDQLDKFKIDHMTLMLSKLSNVLSYVNQHPAFVSGMLSAGAYAAAVVGVSKVITAMKELNLVLGTGPLGAIIRTAMIAGAFGTAFNEGMGWVSDKTSHGEFKGAGWLGDMSYAGRHRDETEKGALIDKLNAWAADANKQGDRQTAKDILNQIKIMVNIDKNNNVSSSSDNINTHIDVARGNF